MVAVSLIAAVSTVARFALSDVVDFVVMGLTAASLAAFWLILPAAALRQRAPERDELEDPPDRAQAGTG